MHVKGWILVAGGGRQPRLKCARAGVVSKQERPDDRNDDLYAFRPFGLFVADARMPRRQIAITGASVTSCGVISALIDQPTTRRENRSMTTAT